MHHEVLKECTLLSEQEKIKFPEVVARLSSVGIESYYADLLSLKKTYYLENEAVSFPCVVNVDKRACTAFSADKVVQAIRLSQAGQIQYQEFLRQIMNAGIIAYFVFIKGRKAIYFGRGGEQHIEEFPSSS